jgi:hypothetical protein
MLIRVKNNLAEDATKTYLSAQMVAGTTKLTVRNTAGLTNGWAVQLGETGEEKSEVVSISSVPSAGTFSVGATSFDHTPDTPVYATKYDQVVFKVSTSGTSGTATAITNGTIGITPDSQYTQFDHTAGSTGYAYKVAYRSSGLASESSDSDWLTITGYDFYSLAKIRERTKAKMVSTVDDDVIDTWINEWMEKMTNTAIDVNEDYALGTTSVSYSGTAQEGTITSSDFKQIRRAWYTEDGSTWYQMTKQELTDFSPNQVFNETHPYYYMRGDTVLGRNPHSNSATVNLDYYKLNAVLDSDSDNLPGPMRGYTNTFTKWALAQSYRADNMINEATALEAQCYGDLDKFKRELTPRNKSGPTYISIVEDFENNDGYY